MKGPDRWLFLEPFVHLASSATSVLFYNALNGKRFEIPKEGKPGRLAEALLNPENGYVTGLSKADTEDPSVAELLTLLRSNFMGDLLDAGWSSGRPANIFPRPHFKSHLTKELISKPESRDSIDFNNYIHEVVLYLNSGASSESDPLYRAPYQFTYPGHTTTTPSEIPWSDLHRFLNHLSMYKITSVQVTGTDIGKYQALPELGRFLGAAGMPAHYHINGNEWDPAIVSKIPDKGKSRLGLHFAFPVDLNMLNSIITAVSDSPWKKRTDFHFVISTATELETARQIIGMANLNPAYINPYLNRSNFDFFRNTVFITRDDIAYSTPGQNQVFSRLTVNESDFGKVTLLPDLNLYANLNDPPCGQLGSISLEKLILNELTEGSSWLRTRSGVSPCRDCIYRFLCPPVSSYELILRRFNFCDVYQPPDGA